MMFNWLEQMHRMTKKEPNYAQKTLAAYRLGMKAKGSIVGVEVQRAPDCCQVMRQMPAGKVYHPDEAPMLPLPRCPQGRNCACVYRPVMSYQLSSD